VFRYPQKAIDKVLLLLISITMKLTQKGQVTIPKHLRNRFGLQRGIEVEFEATDGGVLIRPALHPRADRMATAIASVRGSADAKFTTGAIMHLTRD
jgi:antitoxin PrlF